MGDGHPARSSPTVCLRWLTSELRRLRQEAGYSQAEVAKQLGCQVPRVSLMESGQRSVQDEDLDRLLPFFGVPSERWGHYRAAARGARRKGWWESHGEHTQPSWLREFIGLEQGATQLRSYQPGVIHGLLQTRDYAGAVLRSGGRPTSEPMINRRVDQRVRRQEVLWHEIAPLQLWTIIDEAVLHRVVGGVSIMQSQLKHLATVASENDHITVQVVPFQSGGGPAASWGAFTLLHFPWTSDQGAVYIEHKTGAALLEALEEIDTYELLFEQLSNLALSPADSIERIWLNAEPETKE